MLHTLAALRGLRVLVLDLMDASPAVLLDALSLDPLTQLHHLTSLHIVSSPPTLPRPGGGSFKKFSHLRNLSVSVTSSLKRAPPAPSPMPWLLLMEDLPSPLMALCVYGAHLLWVEPCPPRLPPGLLHLWLAHCWLPGAVRVPGLVAALPAGLQTLVVRATPHMAHAALPLQEEDTAQHQWAQGLGRLQELSCLGLAAHTYQGDLLGCVSALRALRHLVLSYDEAEGEEPGAMGRWLSLLADLSSCCQHTPSLRSLLLPSAAGSDHDLLLWQAQLQQVAPFITIRVVDEHRIWEGRTPVGAAEGEEQWWEWDLYSTL
ncbi:hypothetical protein V8C86DRAFT_2615618 [Haematococcus lacustris]